jgi:uncharacterized protein YjeT (DUF2065 family)/NTP pyrophosphatase (non-canonical NTP hydrolase)
MPSLPAAQKMTENASKVGFDWEKAEDVQKKFEEEWLEFKLAIQSDDHSKIKEEIGDLFLSLVNLCRFVDVNADDALKAAIIKFGNRFKYIEERLALKGKTPMEASLTEMDDLWNESKLIKGLNTVMEFFLCVMGVVLIIEGLPYFAFPEKIKAFLLKLQDVPDSNLRILGLLAMVTGLMLVYFGRT